jgi:hypothetical protein
MKTPREPNAAFSERCINIWRAVRDAGAKGLRRGEVTTRFAVGGGTSHIDQTLALLVRHGYLRKADAGNIQSPYVFDWECKPLRGQTGHLGPGFGDMPEPPEQQIPGSAGDLVHDAPMVAFDVAVSSTGALKLSVQSRHLVVPPEAVPLLREFLQRIAVLEA